MVARNQPECRIVQIVRLSGLLSCRGEGGGGGGGGGGLSIQ